MMDWLRRNWLKVVGSAIIAIALLLVIKIIPMKQMEAWRATINPADYAKLEPRDRVQFQKDMITAENSARLTVAQIIGGLGLLLGLFLTWLNIKTAQGTLKVTEEGKLTERFSKAVELLGSDKLDTRLGGIYALERIARDSRQDHWVVMEVLNAFINENSKLGQGVQRNQRPDLLPSDIQGALTVIGRRKWATLEQRGETLLFNRVHLETGIFAGGNFRKAHFLEANLQWAFFIKTDLRGARFSGSDLSNAILGRADLSNASLDDTNLRGADLTEAIGLTWEQVKVAKIDDETKLPPELEAIRKTEQEKLKPAEPDTPKTMNGESEDQPK